MGAGERVKGQHDLKWKCFLILTEVKHTGWDHQKLSVYCDCHLSRLFSYIKICFLEPTFLKQNTNSRVLGVYWAYIWL